MHDNTMDGLRVAAGMRERRTRLAGHQTKDCPRSEDRVCKGRRCGQDGGWQVAGVGDDNQPAALFVLVARGRRTHRIRLHNIARGQPRLDSRQDNPAAERKTP